MTTALRDQNLAIQEAIRPFLRMLEQGATAENVIREATKMTASLPTGDRVHLMKLVQAHAIYANRRALEIASRLSDGEADLTLLLLSDEQQIIANSPRGIFSLRQRPMGLLKGGSGRALRDIREKVSALFSSRAKPDDVVRSLYALGAQVTQLLPDSVVELLKDERTLHLSLEVAPELDFPIELCRVDLHGRVNFLSEKAAISRTFTDSEAIYCAPSYNVKNIAFVVGKLSKQNGFNSEESAVLEEISPAQNTMKASSRVDIFKKIFSCEDHQLLHYKGHIFKHEDQPCLSLENGEFLPLSQIGDLPEERLFFDNEPLVVLNGCDASLPANLIGGFNSFPHHFSQLKVAATISTMWEVSEVPATAFTKAFYDRLKAGLRIADAIQESRNTLLETAQNFKQTGNDIEFLKYYLTAHAYAYYGPNDLRVSFSNMRKH